MILVLASRNFSTSLTDVNQVSNKNRKLCGAWADVNTESGWENSNVYVNHAVGEPKKLKFPINVVLPG